MLSNCIPNFPVVFSFVYRKIGINVERARFLNLGQKPLNYKSAIDEPGVNQFAVSFKSTHWFIIDVCFILVFVHTAIFGSSMNSSTIFA